MKSFFLVFLIFCGIIFSSCHPANDKAKQASGKQIRTRALTKEEAIAIAEKFVAEQGYTARQESVNLHKIVFEPGEFATDTAELVKMRRNMIKPKAYGAKLYKKKTAWCVGFELTIDDENKGKWVGMDTTGEIVIMNKELMKLDWLDAMPSYVEEQ